MSTCPFVLFAVEYRCVCVLCMRAILIDNALTVNRRLYKLCIVLNENIVNKEEREREKT